ncbi:hypothetical protein GYB22_03060 [bacterium]|nr:hypothetical protein [bacterium]
MQKPIYVFLLISTISMLFPACENELDVTADWKEIAIVYALINPTDEVNYVRIQRAYLDEKTAALEFSDITDSLYFDTLDVKITVSENGVEKNTYTLKKVNAADVGLQKEEGVFNTPEHYLYQLNAPLTASTFADDQSFKLTIFNPKNGQVIFGESIILGRAYMRAPVSDNTLKFFVPADSNYRIYVIYTEGKHAKSYDLQFDFFVEEISLADTNDRDTVNIKWELFEGKETQSLNGFMDASYNIRGQNFFNLFASNLDSNLNVKRRMLNFDVSLIGISEDVYTYINVNEPSIGIVQKKPEFTNLTNAYGIVGCRHYTRIEDKAFDPRTIAALATSPWTSNLNFVTY